MPKVELHVCACDACRCQEVVEEDGELCPECEVGLCKSDVW